MLKRLTCVSAIVAASLLWSGTALAADFFVDKETGNDANIATNCAQPNPCQTIGIGVTAATNAGSGNRVLIDDSPTAYSGNSITLFNDVDVIADNSVAGASTESPTGKPIIQTGAAQGQALFVQGGSGSPGTTIEGFTFRPNNQTAIGVSGPMTSIEDNDFEGPGAPGPTDADVGVVVSASAPLISGNTFTRLRFGVIANSASASTISGNEFSGTHHGNSIELTSGSVTPTVVSGNFIHDLGASSAQAIRVGTSGPTNTISVAFHRNRILATVGLGVNILDTSGPITFDGDLIAGTTLSGISHRDSDTSGDAAISATNVTIVSASGDDIASIGAHLDLDSSLLGGGGVTDTNGATCSITFSRGPVTGAGCDNFQTTANPLFVNAPGDDFHLSPGSPMIDAGNPAAPLAGSLDLDGDARALDGDGACPLVLRRDIGADEVAPPQPTCSTTRPPPASTPVTTTAKKKCKKANKRVTHSAATNTATASKKKCKKRRK
jgi:hypothetical protein